MQKMRTKMKSQKKHLASIASIISTVEMFPNETDADINKIRCAISEEFSPGSPYEEYLTEEITQRILETKRLRQLRKSVLDTAFKESTRTALNLTQDDIDEGGQETDLYYKIISNKQDASAIEATDQQLASYGTSLGSILLNAHRSVTSDIDVIDKRLDLLEKKLRQLQQSLRHIQAQR